MRMGGLIFAGLTFATAWFSDPAIARECTSRNAPAASFADATGTEPPSRCVSMEGIAVGRLFIADESARYRRELRENDPSSSGGVLGLYSGERFEMPTRVRLTGRVVDCATIEASARSARDRAALNGGYCHYYNGRAFRAGRVTRLGEATITRLRRADAGPDLGNLAPLPPGDDRNRLIASADRFFAAVKSGDHHEIELLHGGGQGGTRNPDEVARTVRLVLDDPLAPFAALRGPGGANVEILGWREPLWANDEWREQRRRSPSLDAIACWSVRPDAAAQWPIDSKDADNLPGRPYACTRIHINGTGADAGASFETVQAPTGAREPL